MPSPFQIKTLGANKVVYAQNTVSSKDSYMCANAEITRGITSQPTSLQNCYDRFLNIKNIGTALGILPSNIWSGPGTPPATKPLIFDSLVGINSEECQKIQNTLGQNWLGCLWGSPEAPFSCTCPDVGSQFLDYLKLRLNVASFWNTPITTPPKRREFLDSIKYGPKLQIKIAGNSSIRPGDIVNIKADNLSGYPFNTMESMISDKYYVVSTKNNYTNTGVHETTLDLTKILE